MKNRKFAVYISWCPDSIMPSDIREIIEKEYGIICEVIEEVRDHE